MFGNSIHASENNRSGKNSLIGNKAPPKATMLDYVDAFNHGVEAGRDSLVKAVLHPIDTMSGVAIMAWDGANAASELAFGVTSEGSRIRNIQRGAAMSHGIDNFVNGNGVTRTRIASEVVSTAILGAAVGGGVAGVARGARGASAGLSDVLLKNTSSKKLVSVVKSVKTEKTVYHTATNASAGRGVLDGINPEFFNPKSRFGEAFYVSEIPDTTLAELAHHNATGTNTIRFKLNSNAGKILDLTNPKTAKQWQYVGGNDYSVSQAIAEQAKKLGFDGVRYPSQRGEGANLAIFGNFEKLLKPQMIVPVPKEDNYSQQFNFDIKRMKK